MSSRKPGVAIETAPPAAELRARIERIYRNRTPRSLELYQRSAKSLPGGSTRTATFYLPYPVFMAEGNGCRLRDVDGNEYLDFLNNYASLVHGHAHPRVVAAIGEQVGKGTAHGAPVELQIALAETLQHRVPSMEQLRFTNSGTEAVMGAIRVARAFTGRAKLLKMEGGYHGSYDAAEVSRDPGVDGPPWPVGRPEGPGLSPGLTSEVLVTPFNNLAVAADIIRRHRAELAAVIVEPVLGAGGLIPAEPEFLQGLRELTRETDVLLIFDEVIAFRLSTGGAQGRYGVKPDLTALGKVIGGGLPVGAFGGRADVMALFDPRREGCITHSGTFNGNAATLAAGLATLELLDAGAIAHINRLGERLRAGLADVLLGVRVAAQLTGTGSLTQVHFVRSPVRDYRAAAAGKRSQAWRWLHVALLNRGLFVAPRGMFITSTPMREADVDTAVEQFGEAVDETKALLEVP